MKGIVFLKSEISRLHKAGRLERDEAKLILEDLDNIEHSISTKDIRRLKKSVERISKILVKVL